MSEPCDVMPVDRVLAVELRALGRTGVELGMAPEVMVPQAVLWPRAPWFGGGIGMLRQSGGVCGGIASCGVQAIEVAQCAGKLAITGFPVWRWRIAAVLDWRSAL